MNYRTVFSMRRRDPPDPGTFQYTQEPGERNTDVFCRISQSYLFNITAAPKTIVSKVSDTPPRHNLYPHLNSPMMGSQHDLLRVSRAVRVANASLPRDERRALVLSRLDNLALNRSVYYKPCVLWSKHSEHNSMPGNCFVRLLLACSP